MVKATYLFDWGDTLMVDFADQQGKMYQWSRIQTVEHALETLTDISQHATIYVATNAVDSTVDDIKRAFERVGLAPFISGYFCRFNIGIAKDSKDFYLKIAQNLALPPESMIMVGDNLNTDILPALDAGLQTFWLNKDNCLDVPENCKQIKALNELCR